MTASPIDAFARGFASPFRAIDLILKARGGVRCAALPLAVTALLYAAVCAAALALIWNWQIEFTWDFWGPTGAWLAAAATYCLTALKWLTLVPCIAIVSYFSFTAAGMLIAAPFNEMLSERIEAHLHGRPAPVPLRLGAVVLCLTDTLALLGRQLLYTLLVLPLVLVPVVGAVPLFLVTAWFTAMGFADTAMARHYLRPRHKRPAVAAARWELLGMGTALQLLFLIPFAGLLLLPIGVAAGTQWYCARDWRRILAEAGVEPPRGFETAAGSK